MPAHITCDSNSADAPDPRTDLLNRGHHGRNVAEPVDPRAQAAADAALQRASTATTVRSKPKKR